MNQAPPFLIESPASCENFKSLKQVAFEGQRILRRSLMYLYGRTFLSDSLRCDDFIESGRYFVRGFRNSDGVSLFPKSSSTENFSSITQSMKVISFFASFKAFLCEPFST